MTSGTIILNALRRKWAPSARAPAPSRPTSAGGVLDIVLPPQWPESAASVHWRWRRPDGSVEKGTISALGELPDAARGAATQVWTPARETLLTRANIPTRSAKKIIQALPYALEDLLLDEPDKLDFAFVREATGELVVAVTAKARLAAWRTALQAAGLNVVQVLPAFLAVPCSPGSWSTYFMGSELLVRSGLMDGFSCPTTPDRPPPVLEHALAEARGKQAAPSQLIVYRPPPRFMAEQWQETLGLTVTVERKPIWDEPNAAPAGLSLYTGERATSLASLAAPLRPFAPAAILLLIWFFGSLIFDLTEWWQLRGAYNRTTTEMHETFRRAFPEAKTILDPAKQMHNELARLQRSAAGTGSGDFLPLLERVSRALAGQQEAHLKSINYRERQLTIELTAPSSEAVDQLKRAIDISGAPTQLLGTTKRGDGVEARLRLQSGDKGS